MNSTSLASDIAPQQTKLLLPKKVFFYGPNGGGKGTQAQLLTRFGYDHVEMSALMKKHADTVINYKGLLITIGEAMKQGFFPPDATINDFLKYHFGRTRDDKVLYDGAARTVPQAEMAIDSLREAGLYEDTRAVLLDIPEEQARLQITLRALLAENPRADDLTKVTIDRRLGTFYSDTLPATELFKKDKKLQTVNGTTDLDLKKIVSILTAMRNKYEGVCLKPIFEREHPEIIEEQKHSIQIVHGKVIEQLQSAV